MTPLIVENDRGLYCQAGDFYIDAWQPVKRCIVTHAHSDHAHPGHEEYWCAARSGELLKLRLGDDISLQTLEYGQKKQFKDVTVSLHSAGHILGSCQVRVEHNNEIWVFTGDFKRDDDPSCDPFEIVKCDTLITEATFALPIYQWDAGPKIATDLQNWWNDNAKNKRPSVVFVYALGKAQRILAELYRLGERRKVYVHGAVEPLTKIYRKAGIKMLETALVSEQEKKMDWSQALILATPGSNHQGYLKKFKNCRTGFVSGWMRIRGIRRRRGFDAGFVISDHADWPALTQTIRDSGAKTVLATHGRSDILVKYLKELGLNAAALKTAYQGERDGSEVLETSETIQA